MPRIRIVLAVGIAHDDQARAAGPDVERGPRDRPGTRHEPLLQQFRLGPGAIHLLARRIENALQHEFALTGKIGIDVCSDVHRFLLKTGSMHLRRTNRVRLRQVSATRGPKACSQEVLECQEAGVEALPALALGAFRRTAGRDACGYGRLPPPCWRAHIARSKGLARLRVAAELHQQPALDAEEMEIAGKLSAPAARSCRARLPGRATSRPQPRG